MAEFIMGERDSLSVSVYIHTDDGGAEGELSGVRIGI